MEHCHRAQLQLYVFARTSLQHRIKHVDKSIENTGILHVFPNKGGLLVTFTVDGTKLAFVSCHLAAHEVSYLYGHSINIHTHTHNHILPNTLNKCI
ncbi:hypothetical protein EON63_16445 [archaeon]|nr:MAG: hypothetical protein EON63_16445 [archaeon]